MNVIERFNSYVPVAEKHECWNWQGYVANGGYGRMKVCGKTLTASRLAFILHNNVMIGRDNHVRHLCDNPQCVNPDHLAIGTHADNMADKRGKHSDPRPGEKNGRAVLTEQQVREIRRLRGYETQRQIAESFGVSRSLVSMIQTRKKWRHLGDE